MYEHQHFLRSRPKEQQIPTGQPTQSNEASGSQQQKPKPAADIAQGNKSSEYHPA